MNKRFSECISPVGKKKILACDGGGIKGLISVEILTKLERDLRNKLGNDDLVLAEYFDFVCGTSTGAIIAACISCGMSMNDIKKFYVDSGADMFDQASIFKRYTKYSYKDEPLAKKLQEVLNKALNYTGSGHTTLGDDNLKTVLMMVMRNHTTDSPWPISNNPAAKYNNRERNDCNLNLPLWQLIRASTAAPTFFPPEMVTFAEGTEKEYSFIFLDGGVTAYNNPAFLAFQMATAEPYGLNWSTGEDELLIVSVGTGNAPVERDDLKESDLWVLDHAKNIPTALMNGASAGWDMACRMLGHCRYGEPIDREFGDMVIQDRATSNWTGNKLFSYVRYDPDVTQEGLKNLGLDDIKSGNVQKLDSIDHIKDIQRVGSAFAEKVVQLDHLGSFI